MIILRLLAKTCTLKDSYSSVIIDRKGTVIRNEAVDLY